MGIKNERDARKYIETLVKGILGECGVISAPHYKGTNHLIADRLGVKIKEGHAPNGDGFYIKSPIPMIVMDPRMAFQERKNFTFYHELSHHIIRNDPTLYDFIDTNTGGYNLTRPLEAYCDLIASEFLIPIQKVKKHLEKASSPIKLIGELDYEFPASIPAITIQLANACSHKCIILLCQFGQHDAIKSPKLINQNCINSLYIQHSASSFSCNYSCARNALIPKNHLIYNAFKDKSFLKGKDKPIFRNRSNWSIYQEAFFYKGRVVAELRFSDLITYSNAQMSFPF